LRDVPYYITNQTRVSGMLELLQEFDARPLALTLKVAFWATGFALLAGVALFMTPFVLQGLGDGGEVASPTPPASPSPSPSSLSTPSPTPALEELVYVVKPGDTLSSIARRHACRAQTLARANGLRSPYALRPGQRLSLSGCRG